MDFDNQRLWFMKRELWGLSCFELCMPRVLVCNERSKEHNLKIEDTYIWGFLQTVTSETSPGSLPPSFYSIEVPWASGLTRAVNPTRIVKLTKRMTKNTKEFTWKFVDTEWHQNINSKRYYQFLRNIFWPMALLSFFLSWFVNRWLGFAWFHVDM